MTKKDILKTLDTASFVSLLAGAVLILIFEFTASLVILKLAMILFGAAFLILCTLCSTKLFFMNKQIMENNELLVDKSKESKPWIITRIVLSAILFVMMIVFLCLF